MPEGMGVDVWESVALAELRQPIRHAVRVQLKPSRLPAKALKIFEHFDFLLLKGEDKENPLGPSL